MLAWLLASVAWADLSEPWVGGHLGLGGLECTEIPRLVAAQGRLGRFQVVLRGGHRGLGAGDRLLALDPGHLNLLLGGLEAGLGRIFLPFGDAARGG